MPEVGVSLIIPGRLRWIIFKNEFTKFLCLSVFPNSTSDSQYSDRLLLNAKKQVKKNLIYVSNIKIIIIDVHQQTICQVFYKMHQSKHTAQLKIQKQMVNCERKNTKSTLERVNLSMIYIILHVFTRQSFDLKNSLKEQGDLL